MGAVGKKTNISLPLLPMEAASVGTIAGMGPGLNPTYVLGLHGGGFKSSNNKNRGNREKNAEQALPNGGFKLFSSLWLQLYSLLKLLEWMPGNCKCHKLIPP